MSPSRYVSPSCSAGARVSEQVRGAGEHHQTKPLTTTTAAIPMSDLQVPRRRHVRRANSISNAVLAHLHLSRKHVTFSSTTSPQLVDLNLLASPASGNLGDLDSDNDSEIDDYDAGGKPFRGFRHTDYSISPSYLNSPGATDSATGDGANPERRKNASRTHITNRASKRLRAPRLPGLPALTKYRLYPHMATAMEPAVLHELLFAGGERRLPAFNKRPLTDTPIVSGVASPEDDSEGSESASEPEDVSRMRSGARKGADRKKQILHLSLADLNAVAAKVVLATKHELLGLRVEEPVPRSDSLSPRESAPREAVKFVIADNEAGSGVAGSTGPATAGQKPRETSRGLLANYRFSQLGASKKAEAASPRPTPKVSISSADEPSDAGATAPSPAARRNVDRRIIDQIKRDLLQDVLPELQQQFEKTPSFEKLKSMLLNEAVPRPQKAYTLNIAGQTLSKTSPDGRIALVDVGSKLVIVMVGLPARGKSYVTNKLTRYLNWIQHDCRVFNVGNTRRKDKTNVLGPALRPLPDNNTPLPHLGRSPEVKPLTQSPKITALNRRRENAGAEAAGEQPESEPANPLSPTSHGADFFNPENKTSTEIREKWAMDTLDNLLNWVIDGHGLVGILDATNLTKKRRLKVLKRIQERTNGELKVLFLESVCTDPAILDTNIRLKLSGPDYKKMDPQLALNDFLGRLRNYERAYETIDEEEEKIPGFQYVKMIDVGKKIVSYNVQGFIASQTVYFLLNFNLCERQIWLTRHGESVDNLSGRIGGDLPLTNRGKHFAKALTRFLNFQRKEFRRTQLERFSSRLELRYNELTGKTPAAILAVAAGAVHIPTEPNFCVWTSMLLRSVETGNLFNELEYNVKAMRMLNELGGGKFEGMTYDEIRGKYPREFDARVNNKLTYRYPGVGGELYLDVLLRLRPVISEIERTTDHLLIVSHRVVLRVLLAYFLNLDKSSIVDLDVPLHTLYCLELKPYGTDYAMYEYDEATDWFKKIEPEHGKNVKEVGVNFRERKYSVIPTAPPSSQSARRPSRIGDAARSLSSLNLRDDEANALSSRKLADLNRMRNPQR